MTARERVERTRSLLAAAVGGTAVLWGVAAAVGLVALLGLVDWGMGLSRGVREAGRALAMLSGVGALGWALARGRDVRSVQAVALWIEERRPRLRYSLVTAVDPGLAGHAPGLEPLFADVSWDGEVARAGWQALIRPLLAVLVALTALAATPAGVVERVVTPRPGDILARPGRPANRLADVVVTVTPPEYTALQPLVFERPVTVSAIEGSTVRVEGPGLAEGLEAVLGQRALQPRALRPGWLVEFSAPDRPVALRLRESTAERVIGIEGRPDSVPVVTLTLPARDTVYRAAPNALALSAEARDDWGLTEIWFEYILSSGQGESFRFKSGVAGRTRLTGRTGAAALPFQLDSLGVAPGDVIHLRAVARDNNALVTGGGRLGASETRTLRVARRDEYDSVWVEAMAPTEGDTSALSQRMLIMLAEALEERRPRLARDVVVRESRGIGRDQARLRRRVAEVVFMRLGGDESAEHAEGALGDSTAPLTPEALLAAAEAATSRGAEALDFHQDETPVVALNRPLLEAYNAMWDATRELEVGEPGRALPPMRAALEAIQRARAAERIYLRGRPPAVVVDLNRVRLAGRRDDAGDGRRDAASMDPRTALTVRFQRAVALVDRGDVGAADSLLLLRLDALELAPAVAEGLAQAAAAVRSGQDAMPALAAARAALAGRVRSGPLGPWGVVP